MDNNTPIPMDWEEMKEEEEVWQSNEDNVIDRPVNFISVGNRQELVYSCKFKLEPYLRTYYCVRDPTVVGDKKGLLYGSPVFEAGFKSKWQILICFDHWVGTTRWVSLYLSRVDEAPASFFIDKRFECQMQCQFRIVDKDRKILKARRGMFSSTSPGDSGGFHKFLPFSEALEMMEDDVLFVEAHVTLVKEKSVEKYKSDQGWVSTKEGATAPLNSLFQEGLILAETETAPDSNLGDYDYSGNVDEYEMTRNRYCPESVMGEDEKVEFFLDEESVGFVERKKLIEESKTYVKCLTVYPDDCLFKMVFIRESSPSESFTNWMTVYEYLQFVDGYTPTILEMGSHADIRQLFLFAKHMKTESLMNECVDWMCTRVTPREAPLLGVFLREHPHSGTNEKVDEFRDYYRKNFKAICKDEFSKEIMGIDNANGDGLVAFLLEPE